MGVTLRREGSSFRTNRKVERGLRIYRSAPILPETAGTFPGGRVNLVLGESPEMGDLGRFCRSCFKSTFLSHIDAYQLLEDMHARKQKSREQYIKYAIDCINPALRQNRSNLNIYIGICIIITNGVSDAKT